MFVWFVLGEKNDSGRTLAEDPPLQSDHCTTLKIISRPLIINEIVVEATESRTRGLLRDRHARYGPREHSVIRFSCGA